MTADTKNSILIIGGGLIGLSIAYEFARNKFKVEVLSKNRSCLLYTSDAADE